MPLVQFIALSLFLAGGIGKLIDRLFLSCIVIDFLNIGFGPLRTGIFNVADMAITGGALLMLFSWFFTKDQIEQKKEQANSETTTSAPAE